MAIDVKIADAAALVKIGERSGARYRNRVIASAKNDLGPALQALRQIFIDVLMRLGIVPGTIGTSPQSTMLKNVSRSTSYSNM